MADNVTRSHPVPSVNRLPVYLRFLKELREKKEQVVSCTRIADELGQLSVQVRKDLSMTGITGRPKVGYRVDELIGAIESFLGWDKKTTAFLVGAGSLGSALLGYKGFNEHGLEIVATFDTDLAKVGLMIHGHKIIPISELLERGRNTRVDIGILTVPAEVAQSIADRLVEIGVRGIWNYTPHRLDLPEDIICVDVKLSASFAVLSNQLLNQRVGGTPLKKSVKK